MKIGFDTLRKYMFESVVNFLTFIGFITIVDGAIFDRVLLMSTVFDLFLVWIIIDICYIMYKAFSKN